MSSSGNLEKSSDKAQIAGAEETANKNVANGYMGTDANNRGSRPPKTHDHSAAGDQGGTVAYSSVTGKAIVDADVAAGAAIVDSKLALTTVEKTANKGGVSGYMGLDASSRGTSPPKTHDHSAAGDQGGLLTRAAITDAGRCRVYNSTNISISSGVHTALTFDSERYDATNMHSVASNTSRITIPTTGDWRIGGCVAFANATGARFVGIKLNGTTFIAMVTGGINSGLGDIYNPSCDYHFTANDYVELTAFQNTGSALNVTSSGNYSPEFWASPIV